MEKMQAQELLLGLRLPELDDLGQLFRSLPTSTLVGLGALTAVLAYWLATRPRGIAPPCDLSNQSEKVEGGGRRSMLGDSPELLTHYFEDATTLYEVFQRGLHVSGDGPCLGSRLPNQPYKWLSYKEVMTRAEHLGSGLLYQGCQPNSDQLVGVFAQNRPEWIIAELACYTYSMVVVPLYDTLGPDAIRYIINIAEISTVICDKPEKAKVLLGNVERQETPGLKRIILMDLFDPELVEQGNNSGVHIQSLKDVERQCFVVTYIKIECAMKNKLECFFPSGNPKGVMLTHGNVVADFAGFLKVTDVIIRPNKDDVLISFLPLAHMFERLIEAVVYCHGGRIGFFQGDIRLLSEDMKVLRPTIFPVVPRLLNRMYDKIFSQANNSVKRWILNFAAKRKAAEVSRGVIRSDSIWDKIFFSKIQASLGGRLRMIITGAAPTSPTVLGFLRAALGCQVYEAYGQTECTAGCTYTTPGDWTSGKSLETEVLVGFSRDVKLHVISIAVEVKTMSMGFLYSLLLQACLVAIVVPDPEVMPSWARKKGLDGSYEDLCKNGELKKAILEDLVRLGKASGLHSFEQVKNIYVHSDMFSIENGLLTPTLKAKRPELRQYFKQEIEELYQNITM
uniref:long-chain-fatty-acid--CoA ligase n=1 Tax=Astyanax mexicanus TaxID=7994 RepID=A0A8B9LAF1_ASTMX